MTPALFSLDPSESVNRAIRLMVREGIRRVLVMEKNGTLVGILTASDVLRQLAWGGVDADLPYGTVEVPARGLALRADLSWTTSLETWGTGRCDLFCGAGGWRCCSARVGLGHVGAWLRARWGPDERRRPAGALSERRQSRLLETAKTQRRQSGPSIVRIWRPAPWRSTI